MKKLIKQQGENEILFNTAAFRAEIARRWPRTGRARLAELTGYSLSMIHLIANGLHPSEEARKRIFEALGPEAAKAISSRDGR